MKLRTFWEISNIAKDDKGLHDLADPKLGLLAMMAKIIREDAGESRSAAIGVLWNLSVAPENRITIIDPEIGLLAALTNVLHLIVHHSTDETECVHRTLGVLHNITLSSEAQEGVGAYLPIYDALTKALRSHDAITTDRAAGILWNLATCAGNRNTMVAHTGLMVAVSHVLNSPVVEDAADDADNTDPGAKALIVIYYCTLANEARAIVGAVDGMLAALLQHFKAGNAESRLKVMGVYAHLSSTAENKGPLADPSIGLLPELVLALKNPSSEAELRSKVCGCLWNLSVASSNRALLADVKLGLVSVLVDLLNACNYAGGKEGEGTLVACVYVYGSWAMYAENVLQENDAIVSCAVVCAVCESMEMFHVLTLLPRRPPAISLSPTPTPLLLVQRRGSPKRRNRYQMLHHHSKLSRRARMSRQPVSIACGKDHWRPRRRSCPYCSTVQRRCAFESLWRACQFVLN